MRSSCDREAGEVGPETAQRVKGGVAGDVAGEGEGFTRVMEQGRADCGGGAVAQQFEKPFGVDGASPDVGFGLEAIGTELQEQDAGPSVVGEEVVERQGVGDGEDGVGDSDVAGAEAGGVLDLRRIEAGHGGGVAEEEHVAGAIVHGEDGVIGLHPGAGAVVEEEV